MDIIELGAIGELVGGVAVIASLVFVGLQVRQGNSLAVSASTRVEDVEKHISEDAWGAYDRTFGSIISQPGAIASWQRQKGFFGQPFVNYVEGSLSTTPRAGA